jgi:predicted metalloprotease with PDZ domain
VKAPEHEPFVVEVRARCDGLEVSGFSPDEAELEAFVTREAPSEPVPGATELVYRVDLDGAARKFERFDVAARFGASLVAGASSFLFSPVPEQVGVPVSVTFDEAKGFATGLRRARTGHTIESHELRVATYTAFGARDVRRLDVPGTALRVALLDGPVALGAERLVRWVETAYRAVAAFYGKAPDTELLVVIAPLPKQRGVKFGRLLPESAPGIVLLVGEITTEHDLADDWMLVHELFHVGTPSYGAKSGWFDEGLATYFEPLVRARAGLVSVEKLWREFASEMPRGLDALTQAGLSNGASRDAIYWGGGLFCLLADVEARKRTGGARGLEDGLRAVLRAGGNSSQVWALDDTFSAIDRGIGVPVVAPLAERHMTRGAPVDFARLLRELGVVVKAGGHVRLDESAPLAAVRRAITRGKTP